LAKTPKPPRGFEEGQTPFGPSAMLVPVFLAYAYKCAFTGEDISAEALADPLLPILRLADQLTPGSVIPASVHAVHAYERGHLAIGPRFEFLVALDRIDPEFLETLNPIGRLTLPADPAFHPNAALLKAHRDAFAEGFIE